MINNAGFLKTFTNFLHTGPSRFQVLHGHAVVFRPQPDEVCNWGLSLKLVFEVEQMVAPAIII